MNTSTVSWTHLDLLPVGNSPRARAAQAMTTLGTNVWMFGGRSESLPPEEAVGNEDYVSEVTTVFCNCSLVTLWARTVGL